jgi:cytidine deaminase
MLRSRALILFVLVVCGALAATIVVIAGGDGVREKTISVPGISEKTTKKLVEQARKASKNAYCPYSKFPVGAAVLTDSGEVFTGCNVENASYGLTICAERNAVFQMVAQAKRKIKMVVIYTPTAKPSAPCGACRQVINEFAPDAVILSVCDGPDVLKKKLTDLLPDAFGPGNLK